MPLHLHNMASIYPNGLFVSLFWYKVCSAIQFNKISTVKSAGQYATSVCSMLGGQHTNTTNTAAHCVSMTERLWSNNNNTVGGKKKGRKKKKKKKNMNKRDGRTFLVRAE